MARMTNRCTLPRDKFIAETARDLIHPVGPWFPEHTGGVRQLTPEETGEMIRTTVCTDEPEVDE